MSIKRPAEDAVPVLRSTRIKLASPSPERTCDSDTESIHSCQGYKTELVDAGDISSPSPAPSPPPAPHQAEYEVVEREDQKLNFYCSEDSDPGYMEKEFCVANSSEFSDDAILGDTSEENSTSPTSNSDVDPGLPRSDYLDFEKCLLCQTEKKNVSYPYCVTCFTWKKNFFPSRPKRKRRDFKRNCTPKQMGVNDSVFYDSGLQSTETQPSEDIVDGPSQLSASTSSSNSATTVNSEHTDSCRVCFLKPENGLFVHLNTAHRYGCYGCATKIWYNSGGCPLCRRKVYKITQLFT